MLPARNYSIGEGFHSVKTAVDPPTDPHNLGFLGYAANAARGAVSSAGNFLFSEHQQPLIKSVADAAGNVHEVRGYGSGFVNGVKNTAHSIGETAREWIAGSPLTVDQQIREKGWLHPVKDYWGFGTPAQRILPNATLGQRAGHAFNAHAGKLLSIGMPAYDLYHTVRHGDPNQLGANVGGVLAGLAAAPYTYRMGLAGNLAQAPVMAAGRWLGGKVDQLRGAQPTTTPIAQQMPTPWQTGAPITAGTQSPTPWKPGLAGDSLSSANGIAPQYAPPPTSVTHWPTKTSGVLHTIGQHPIMATQGALMGLWGGKQVYDHVSGSEPQQVPQPVVRTPGRMYQPIGNAPIVGPVSGRDLGYLASNVASHSINDSKDTFPRFEYQPTLQPKAGT